MNMTGSMAVTEGFVPAGVPNGSLLHAQTHILPLARKIRWKSKEDATSASRGLKLGNLGIFFSFFFRLSH